MPVPPELLNKHFIVVDAHSSIGEVLAQIKAIKNLWTYVVVKFSDGQYAVVWAKEIVDAAQGRQDLMTSEGGCAKEPAWYHSNISVLDFAKVPPIDEKKTTRAESKKLLKDAPMKRLPVLSGATIIGVLAESSRSVKSDAGADIRRTATESAPPTEQRWINAELVDHPSNEPLQIGQPYTLAFDVDTQVRDASIAKDAPFTYQYSEDESSVTLTVQLSSSDFAIHTEPQKLIVPRQGRSKNKARFDIEPQHDGEGVISAVFLKDGNFIQLLTLKIHVGSSHRIETESMSRPLESAFDVQPRDLSLVITHTGLNFKLILAGCVCAEATLPLTLAEIDQMAKRVRAVFSRLVNSEVGTKGVRVYQSRLDIPEAVNRVALKQLAETGYLLFQQIFFGDAADAQTRLVGERLIALSESQRLKIQVVSQQFLLPWGLLYLASEFDPDSVQPERFLGFKHVIEHIPLQPSMQVVDSIIKSQPNLTVSLNVNREIEKESGQPLIQEQVNYWNDVAVQHAAKVVVRDSREAIEKSLADPNNADQLLYFYCHAVSKSLDEGGGPDDSRLEFPGSSLTLKDLKLRAPARKPFVSAPLVFINACESAELSPLFYGGFVPYFMSKGARGVIGTECEIPALFARHWAERFFDQFLTGKTLAEVMLDLRREFLFKHNNVLGLLYAVYCDGDTRIVPAVL